MRLERHGEEVVAVLSRRNLESLLAKLDGHPANSACTIIGGAGAIGLKVVAEDDTEHYANAARETMVGVAGGMHVETAAEISRPDGFIVDAARGGA